MTSECPHFSNQIIQLIFYSVSLLLLLFSMFSQDLIVEAFSKPEHCLRTHLSCSSLIRRVSSCNACVSSALDLLEPVLSIRSPGSSSLRCFPNLSKREAEGPIGFNKSQLTMDFIFLKQHVSPFAWGYSGEHYTQLNIKLRN